MQSPSEKRLLLNLNEGSSSRRPWSISEIDELSPNPATKKIPWHSQFAFDLTDINIVTRIGPPDHYERHKEGLIGEDQIKIRERSRVNSTLKPCNFSITQFSWLGAAVPIKWFNLSIFPDLHADGECLKIRGIPNQSWIDFELFIERDMFRNISDKIERNLISGARIYINNVSGIYSEDDIHLCEQDRTFGLLGLNEDIQPIAMPDNVDITPPRMDNISDFEIQIYSKIIDGKNLIHEKVDDY